MIQAVPDENPEDHRKLGPEEMLIQNFLKMLRENPDLVCVATDKTSKFTTLSTKSYNAMMNYHLQKSCIEVPVQTLKSYEYSV